MALNSARERTLITIELYARRLTDIDKCRVGLALNCKDGPPRHAHTKGREREKERGGGRRNSATRACVRERQREREGGREREGCPQHAPFARVSLVCRAGSCICLARVSFAHFLFFLSHPLSLSLTLSLSPPSLSYPLFILIYQ